MSNGSSDLVLFDGDCNLCNGTVQFILRRDPHARFHFASLQSAAGARALAAAGAVLPLPDSFVLLTNGKLWLRSGAALRIARRLRFPWSLGAVFLLVPRPVRDCVYDWVARHRYRWFGKRDQCLVPSPEWAARFLDVDERRAATGA